MLQVQTGARVTLEIMRAQPSAIWVDSKARLYSVCMPCITSLIALKTSDARRDMHMDA